MQINGWLREVRNPILLEGMLVTWMAQHISRSGWVEHMSPYNIQSQNITIACVRSK